MQNLRIGIRLLAFLVLLTSPSFVQAQGLLWSFPEPGTWARYEGTYRQVKIRPNVAEGNEELNWIRELTIKSLGTETAEYQGQDTTCHWLEFKLQTGTPSEAGIDPGNYGVRIYKILVPESALIAKTKDSSGILVDYIPIVKGYRLLNSNSEAEEMTTPVFQVYPLLTWMRHYRELKMSGEETIGTTKTEKMSGSLLSESRINRTRNEMELWRSKDAPFGLVKWKVQVFKESKDRNDARGEFTLNSEIHEDMALADQGEEAQSELELP